MRTTLACAVFCIVFLVATAPAAASDRSPAFVHGSTANAQTAAQVLQDNRTSPRDITCEDETIKVSGAIEDLEADWFTVCGKKFFIVEETEFEHGSRADLHIGLNVKVEGKMVDDRLVAESVDIRDESEDTVVKTEGTITAIDGDTFTVNGKIFRVTDSTEFDDGDAADLVVGAYVRVEGVRDGSTIRAEEVKFSGTEDKKPTEVEVEGLITAVGADSFSVAGKTFTVTAKTKFIKTSFAELSSGLMVAVKGVTDTNGTVALWVKKTDDNKGTLTAAGLLTGVAAASGDVRLALTLDDGNSYLADAGMPVVGRHGLKSTAADLVPGLTLRIHYRSSESSGGTVREVSGLWIVGMEKLKGKIGGGAGPSALLGSFMVDGVTIHFDQITRVIGSKDGITDPALLPDGLRVEILANPFADGSLLANKIIVTSGSDDTKKYVDGGVVESVDTSGDVLAGFTLNGVFITVTDSTAFRVKGYSGPMPRDEFIAGLTVKVVGTTKNNMVSANLVQISLPAFRFTGPLDAVDADRVTVLGHEVLVTQYTHFHDYPDGTTLADLQAGDFVEVKAFLWPNGEYVASDIEPADDTGEVTLRGVVTAKTVTGTATTLEICGIQVRVTALTVIIGDPADLIVGARVEITGVAGEDGVIMASSLEIDD